MSANADGQPDTDSDIVMNPVFLGRERGVDYDGVFTRLWVKKSGNPPLRFHSILDEA